MLKSNKRLNMKWLLLLFIIGMPLPLSADLEKGLDAVHRDDYSAAYKIFLKLAEEGNAEAQHNLGILFQEGKGTEKNLQEAAKWFKKAADQGVVDAQYHLGNLYEFGKGLPQNYAEAANWYSKAAEQGHSSAQTNLAVLYANGQGVNQDIILAYVWSNLAASQGVMAALQNREIVAKEMSPEMLRNVRNISREYFQKYVAPFQSKQRPAGNRRALPPE